MPIVVFSAVCIIAGISCIVMAYKSILEPYLKYKRYHHLATVQPKFEILNVESLENPFRGRGVGPQKYFTIEYEYVVDSIDGVDSDTKLSNEENEEVEVEVEVITEKYRYAVDYDEPLTEYDFYNATVVCTEDYKVSFLDPIDTDYNSILDFKKIMSFLLLTTFSVVFIVVGFGVLFTAAQVLSGT